MVPVRSTQVVETCHQHHYSQDHSHLRLLAFFIYWLTRHLCSKDKRIGYFLAWEQASWGQDIFLNNKQSVYGTWEKAPVLLLNKVETSTILCYRQTGRLVSLLCSLFLGCHAMLRDIPKLAVKESTDCSARHC